MPFDRKKYPKDWEAVRKFILDRDSHCCKWCGKPNHLITFVVSPGYWWDSRCDLWRDKHGVAQRYAPMGERKEIKVVLTIAHIIDPDPLNIEQDNLAALCQSCHNKLDAPLRAKNRAATLHQKKQVSK